MPSSIDVLVEGKELICIEVDYPWKPEICSECSAFGHNATKCKAPKVWKPKQAADSAAASGGGSAASGDGSGVSGLLLQLLEWALDPLKSLQVALKVLLVLEWALDPLGPLSRQFQNMVAHQLILNKALPWMAILLQPRRVLSMTIAVGVQWFQSLISPIWPLRHLPQRVILGGLVPTSVAE